MAPSCGPMQHSTTTTNNNNNNNNNITIIVIIIIIIISIIIIQYITLKHLLLSGLVAEAVPAALRPGGEPEARRLARFTVMV